MAALYIRSAPGNDPTDLVKIFITASKSMVQCLYTEIIFHKNEVAMTDTQQREAARQFSYTGGLQPMCRSQL